MKLATALSLLALAEPLTAEAIKAAFAEKVKACHPDTESGLLTGMAPIRDYQEARKVLLAHLEGQNNTCKMCGGSGKVAGRVGSRPCVGCSGKGERQ